MRQLDAEGIQETARVVSVNQPSATRKGNVARDAQPLQDDTTLDIKLFSFAALPVSTCLFCYWFYSCQLLLVFLLCLQGQTSQHVQTHLR